MTTAKPQPTVLTDPKLVDVISHVHQQVQEFLKHPQVDGLNPTAFVWELDTTNGHNPTTGKSWEGTPFTMNVVEIDMDIRDPDERDDAFCHAIHQRLIKNQGALYVIACEAWVVSHDDGTPTTSPAKHPNRKEALVYYAENIMGDSCLRAWEIRRTNGRASAFLSMPMGNDNPVGVAKHFANLFHHSPLSLPAWKK